MTDIYYETKSLIDQVTYGYAQTIGRGGFDSLQGLQNFLGFNPLPLPEYTPPNGSSVVQTVDYGFYYKLYPNGTTPSQYLPPPNYILLPNAVGSDYPEPYYATYITNGNDIWQLSRYYTAFGFLGTPISPGIDIPGKELKSRLIVIWTRKRYLVTPVAVIQPLKPNYYSLLSGYNLDSRTVPNNPQITPIVDEQITIEYFRQNKLGSASVASIDWMTYTVDLVVGKQISLPIVDCVLGSLYCSSQSVIDKITALPTLNEKYAYSSYFLNSVPALFANWISLWNAALVSASIPVNATSFRTETESSRLVRTIGANNNCWNNRSVPTPDLNFDPTHPVFLVDNDRAYDWHIKPQSDGSSGDLVMNSPLLIDIGKAIDAGKWSVNLDDPDLPRVDNLGWRIQRMNEVLGIRVGADGKFDPVKEKKIVRQVIPAKQKLDAEKVGVNSFGEGGMVVKRINNRFNGDKIESDQCVIIHDLLQLIQEYHEQHNLAIGLQESSAIEIKYPKDKEGKNRARFDNQLGLLLEMFNLLSSANEMTRANLISSLITQSQTNEVIAGLGLPSVTKTIPIEIDKKVSQVPYKGIAAHRSISQEIATCTYNVGIILGQLL